MDTQGVRSPKLAGYRYPDDCKKWCQTAERARCARQTDTVFLYRPDAGGVSEAPSRPGAAINRKHNMDLSDLARPAAPKVQTLIEPLDPQALIAQLGSEVATTLSSALERVAALSANGRIDREGLRALREEIDLARRAGIMGQQVVRLGNGQVQLSPERLDLTALLREALRQRGREIEARGIEVRQVFTAAQVSSDATLLFSLMQTVLDWSFEHTVSRIDIKLDIKNWPANARLSVAYAHRPPDEVDGALPAGAEEPTLSTMSWRLLQQTAAVLGLPLQRRDSADKTELSLDFPKTLAPSLNAPDLIEQEDTQPGLLHLNPLPLAGRHVLVLAGRREVRNTVREALRPMGLMIDYVGSVDEAQELCADALPHAVVYEASIGGERFERLRAELVSRKASLAFVQIAEQGKGFQVLNLGGRQIASVGRDGIIESLPEALSFELARHN